MSEPLPSIEIEGRTFRAALWRNNDNGELVALDMSREELLLLLSKLDDETKKAAFGALCPLPTSIADDGKLYPAYMIEVLSEKLNQIIDDLKEVEKALASRDAQWTAAWHEAGGISKPPTPEILKEELLSLFGLWRLTRPTLIAAGERVAALRIELKRAKHQRAMLDLSLSIRVTDEEWRGPTPDELVKWRSDADARIAKVQQELDLLLGPATQPETTEAPRAPQRITADEPCDRACECYAQVRCDLAPHVGSCKKIPARWFALEGWPDSIPLCAECSADLRRSAAP